MNRITILLLLSGFALGQAVNPCEDVRFLELKKKSLDNMSDREYEYFKQKDKECSEFTKNQSAYSIKEETVSKYAYNNLIGGLYFNNKGSNVFAINSLERISNNFNIGFMFSTYYVDSNLPGQSYVYIPYLGFDLYSSKYFTPILIVGGKYAIREWSNFYSGVSGKVNHFGLIFGLELNIKISEKFGFGLIAGMGENFYFTAYSDGSAEITKTEYEFFPAFTVNIYDLFPSR